jgi:hypothetical protein
MGIREKVDELADGIIGRDLRQQLALMYPPESQLVAGNLHPDRINGVLRDGLDVGNDNTFIPEKRDGVFMVFPRLRLYLYRHDIRYGHVLGLLGYDNQRITSDHKIKVLCIMMGRIEGDRVQLLPCQIPGIRRNRATIIAAAQE